MTPSIPPGFEPIRMRPNPYIDPLGPLYGRREGQGLVVAIRVERRHCNPSGICHGGMITTLADMMLILNCNMQTGLGQYMVTIQLSCDYVGPAPEGCWLEGEARVTRHSPRLVFCDGLFSTDGKPVARVSGIFKPTGHENRDFRPDEQFPAA